MFSHLMNLGFTRSPLQAIGFYITYFCIFLLLAAIVGAMSVFTADAETLPQLASQLGIVTVTVATLILGSAIAYQKHLLGSIPVILLILGSGALALFGGAIFGLVPIAFLTMRMPGTSTIAVQDTKKCCRARA
ncbi:MAG: hypothetical protein WCX29_02525 [Candidatus Peribacteraceae bacterium]